MSIDDVEAGCDLSSRDALTDVLLARARAAAIADAALLDAVVAVADRDPEGFDADLVAFTLAWTQIMARAQVEFGRYLQRVIKPVWAALCAGELDIPRARVFHDVLGAVDDDIAFTIALDMADRAGGWTTGQLRDRLRRAVLKADPGGAARRTARTIAQRRVTLAPERDATAALFATSLPAARAVAAYERVDAYARARRADGDARTLDQLRADTLLDLLEGVEMASGPLHRRGVVEITIPWTNLTHAINPTAINPTAADLTGTDPTGTDPDDAAIGAAVGGVGGPAPSSAGEPATLSGFGPLDAPTAGGVVEAMLGRDDIVWRLRVDDEHGQLRHLGPLPTPRDRAALAGILTNIVDAAPGRWRPQPPREADPRRRMPGRALTRWIRARDGTCRAPGCRAPATVCDIDHTIAYVDGGPTAHDNLALACRHHHRLKHEAGWRVTQPTAGVLAWTSPHGDRFIRTHTC